MTGAHCENCEMQGRHSKAVKEYISVITGEKTRVCGVCYVEQHKIMSAVKDFDEFGGVTYDPEQDRERLGDQMCRVFDACLDGNWHTLKELSAKTGDPEASISARLRDVRKKFGKAAMESKRLAEGKGTWVYRVHVRLAA